MHRTALAIILLALIYNWEEIKYVIKYGLATIFRKQYVYKKDFNEDENVRLLLAITLLPAGLIFIFISELPLTNKLSIILIQLIILSSLLIISRLFNKALNQHHYSAGQKILLLTFLIAEKISRPRGFYKTEGKFILGFCIGLLGLVLVGMALNSPAVSGTLPNHEFLIMIAVSLSFVYMTILVLEKIFKSIKLNIFSHFRIIAGLIISIYLLNP